MVGTSVAGKSFIAFYRRIKLKNAFSNSYIIGKHYQGGFESKMSRREASLILGVR